MRQPRLTRLVVDSDVCSFMFNRDPVRAPRYKRHLTRCKPYLSFASVGEILYGAWRRDWSSERIDRLRAHLKRYVVVQSNPRIVESWAAIRLDARRQGRPITSEDAWVAAVATTLGLPLLTHNAAHFANIHLLEVITEPDE